MWLNVQINYLLKSNKKFLGIYTFSPAEVKDLNKNTDYQILMSNPKLGLMVY